MTDPIERDIELAMTAMVARDAVAIPPYPAVALQLGQLVRSEGYGFQDIVRLVGVDPTLSADLLRCANSGAYSRGGEVTSLQQAVSRLGAQEVVRLAVTSALAETTRAPGPLQTMKRAAWQRSVAGAMLCQELGGLRGLSREDAFLCGLLHDFGHVLAITAIEEILVGMPEIGARSLASWTVLVERVHLHLGGLLATRWGLPELFREVMARHHDEERTWHGPSAPLVKVVAASDEIVRRMLEREHLDESALSAVHGLEPGERARLAEIIPDIPGVIASFEGEPLGRTPVSKVIAPAPTLPEGFRRIDLPVQQMKPKKRGPYTLFGLAPSGWVMMGKEAIDVNSLIEVVIASTPPITAWSHVTHCAPEGGGVRIECRVFAASATTSAQMYELFRSAAVP